jgi:hypothetical protein
MGEGSTISAVHGTYSWGDKRVAYRNDYCMSCNAPRMAFQHRTFEVYHLYWIPILPLGFWRRWRCGVCGNDPHANVRTRRSLKWAGSAILGLLALSAWAVSPERKPEESAYIWALRVGGPIAFVWAVRATLKSPPDVRVEDLLRTVSPVVDVHCPECGVMLFPEEPAWRCPQCGMRRKSLPAG